jgi:hypothetical protein
MYNQFMRKMVNKLWTTFKQAPDAWFFCGFLLTFTFSIRKVLLFYPVEGSFNEYSGIYLYLSDIFLILTVTAWLGSLILYNKKELLSIYKKITTPYTHFFWIAIFIIWAFLSIAWASNSQLAIFRSIKLLEFVLLFLYVCFRIVPAKMFHVEHLQTGQGAECSTWNNCHVSVDKNVPRGTFSLLLQLIIFLSLFQAIIGIVQFFKQSSIGLFWLKESLISPSLPGVAKVVFDGHKFIRAYGLFPHPNILAGFLVFSIILTLLYLKMFHVEHLADSPDEDQIVPRGTIGNLQKILFKTKECSTWNIWSKMPWILRLILAIQILATILTFSKAAIFGLILGCVYLLINVPRPPRIDKQSLRVEAGGTFRDLRQPKDLACQNKAKHKLFHVEQLTGQAWNNSVGKRWIKYFGLSLACLILLIYILKPSWQSFVGTSVSDRLVYLNVSRGTIVNHPILGLGIGQYVPYLNSVKNLLDWQFQPVHNVFLLIWAELGIIGLGLFIVFLFEIFRKKIVPRGTILDKDCINCSTPIEMFHVEHSMGKAWNKSAEKYFKAILIVFLTISLFDHYFWDIQQGQIMLWVVLGVLAGLKLAKEN